MKEETQKKYVETVGRRKTSIARAVEDYFKVAEQRVIIQSPMVESKVAQDFTITIRVTGGGVNSQAEAIRHAISRALIVVDETLRKDLKKAGYLKRDPRAKERRKFGLKKARKAPQWSKR